MAAFVATQLRPGNVTDRAVQESSTEEWHPMAGDVLEAMTTYGGEPPDVSTELRTTIH